ncbi:MAG: FkbM family methyltransferase [Zoogloeaceae bacterium]|jgi:FkbM family methyltransferase|nr:FkbM family methyltransferase [Zoogloeaceae bacterium]
MTTSNKFAALLKDCVPSAPRWRPGVWPVLIYGAGDTGRKAAIELKSRGAEIAGFLDAKAQPGQSLDGLPIFTLPDWLARHDPVDYEVFIAISNEIFRPQIPELRRQITECGFARSTYHFWTLVQAHLPNRSPNLLQNARQCYENFLPELGRLDEILADEKSQQCLMEYVRANCQEESTRSYSSNDQYHPADLPALPHRLRFIDGGAFTGDTLVDLFQNGYRFDAAAAFEPDPENFSRLVRNTTSCENIIRFPCALGDETRELRFNATATPGSHILRGGGDTHTVCVQCVSLDDVLPTFAPNFIKMDIEGAEPEALMGAKNMIVRHRPYLAICLYHHVDHLWRIPLMIHEWNLNYRFYIRQHDPIFDLVLYAYPDKDQK